MEQRDAAMQGTFHTVPMEKWGRKVVGEYDPTDRTMQDMLDATNHERPHPTALFQSERGGWKNAIMPIAVGLSHYRESKNTYTEGIAKPPFTAFTPGNTALGGTSIELGMEPHGRPIFNFDRPHHCAFGEKY